MGDNHPRLGVARWPQPDSMGHSRPRLCFSEQTVPIAENSPPPYQGAAWMVLSVIRHFPSRSERRKPRTADLEDHAAPTKQH